MWSSVNSIPGLNFIFLLLGQLVMCVNEFGTKKSKSHMALEESKN